MWCRGLTAKRTQRILEQIDGALKGDRLSPDAASRLAGRLTFLSQSTFGATGRAAIKPLYSRAADTAANSEDTLSVGLRSALMALRRLVASSRPRLVPWPGRVRGPFPVLYADAFFLDGDLRKKPGHIGPGEVVPRAARWQNGWGFVLILDGHVFYDYGAIKPEHLAPFAARKAFIYVLEIVAQVSPHRAKMEVWGDQRRHFQLPVPFTTFGVGGVLKIGSRTFPDQISIYRFWDSGWVVCSQNSRFLELSMCRAGRAEDTKKPGERIDVATERDDQGERARDVPISDYCSSSLCHDTGRPILQAFCPGGCSGAHAWIHEIPNVPSSNLATPQPRERASDLQHILAKPQTILIFNRILSHSDGTGGRET